MICELNKIYILSAPKAAESMASDPDHFITSTSTDQTYIEMGKIHSAGMKEVTVTSIAKIFTYKGSTLQAVIHVTSLPRRMAEQRLTETVRKYARNVVEQQKSNHSIPRESA